MRRSFLVLLLAASASPAVGQPQTEREQTRQPNAFTLTIKTGDVRLLDRSQTIASVDRTFEQRASDVFAIEAEGRLQGEAENVSLGGEIIRYRNHFRRASAPGAGFDDTMYTQGFLVKSKYYFRPGKAWQPYVGGGIGTVWSHDFSGPIHGVANGTAYQAVAGMQLRADRIGVRLEYAYLRARVPDNNEEEVNASTRGLFVGLSFFFGRR